MQFAGNLQKSVAKAHLQPQVDKTQIPVGGVTNPFALCLQRNTVPNKRKED